MRVMPKIRTPETPTGAILHEWRVQEYERHSRGAAWHALMAALGAMFVLYGIFSNNFLFSLIVILFAIIIFLQAHEDPLDVPFQIAELGIIVGSRFYSYTELENFYIIYRPPEVKTLYIRHKSALRPLLRIPLLDVNPVDVRRTLRASLDEDVEKEEEPISDLFARRWKIH